MLAEPHPRSLALGGCATAGTVGDRWLVRDGIKAGERVIVEGGQKVQPGATVRPVEWRAERVTNALPAAGAR